MRSLFLFLNPDCTLESPVCLAVCETCDRVMNNYALGILLAFVDCFKGVNEIPFHQPLAAWRCLSDDGYPPQSFTPLFSIGDDRRLGEHGRVDWNRRDDTVDDLRALYFLPHEYVDGDGAQ